LLVGVLELNEGSFIDCIADRVVARLQEKCLVVASSNPEPRLLDIKHAAVRMGRSVSTVRQMIGSGELPRHVVKQVGRRVMVIVAELDEWLRSS
jgi:excisionase family DNA binding protein